MARLGTVELETANNGWLEIDVYDPSDFQFTPIELWTPNGWAVPFVTAPSEADTPLEVYTESNGWQGINTVGFVTIDDFEDGDIEEYIVSVEGEFDPTSSRAAFQGDYGLKAVTTDFEQVLSKPSFTPSLDYYPSRGDEFRVVLRGRGDDSLDSSDTGGRIKFGWALQDAGNPDTDGYDSPDVVSHYTVELASDLGISTANAFNLYREDDSNNIQNVADVPMYEWEDDIWYQVVVDFGKTTTDATTATCYQQAADGSWEIVKNGSGTELQVTHTDTAYDDGGIMMDAKDGEYHWDWWRKTAPL